jgi:hypothetical protein
MARRSPAISVPDLVAAPELAVLAALLAVLEIVIDALLAVHPALTDHERPYWIPTPDAVRHAASVLANVHRLRRAVDRYRLAVMPSPEPTDPVPADDHIPF